MLDSRRHIKKFTDLGFRHSAPKALIKFFLSFVFAWIVAYLLPLEGLSGDAQSAFFILLFAAALWISEAIPAFAVSLLLIAMEILMLGFHGFHFGGKSDWAKFLEPWGSPLVFLFFAGFIMANAAAKTGLDHWLAGKVLLFAGEKPHNVLTGLMGITFLLSMFISNTATAAMMITVLTPILASLRSDNPFQKGALLAIAVSANIGGMGTIIGTPPNAIAVGILGENAPDFLTWMTIALPPALLSILLFRYLLIKLYPSNEAAIDLEHIKTLTIKHNTKDNRLNRWIVIVVFMATVCLWLTSPLHHIPTTVVSFLPVIAFTVFGITDVENIAELRWDVIILIVGGLSLGLAISDTGLAQWMADTLAPKNTTLVILALFFCYGVVTVSNFMSNTAASNIMLPIIAAITATSGNAFMQIAVISVALSASLAMLLPVSTPPNAIVYSMGRISSKDFFKIGILAGSLGPLLIWGWFYLVWL